MKVDLTKIDFGKDTAEFDLNLSNYFVETPIYSKIKSGEKSIITGRKGAGKTALMTYFVSNETEDQAIIKIESSMSTYSRIKTSIDTASLSEKPELDDSFKHAWLFSTLLALSERVINEHSIALTNDAKSVFNFAKNHLNYTPDDKISTIAQYIINWFKNLKSVSILGTSIQRDLNSANKIIFNDFEIKKLIASAVKELNRIGKKVFLFYDKLDDKWDGTAINISMLQGLLLATKEIKSLSLGVYPVVLLRDDIFRRATATFQHVDHYRMEKETVKWEEQNLVDLLSKRIIASLSKDNTTDPIDNNLQSEEIWKMIFVAEIPYKSTKTPITAYLIERTLSRPRDLILFANLAKEAAVEDKKCNGVILKNHLLKAEKDYSSQKLDDLIAELSVEYPNAEKILEHFKEKTYACNYQELKAITETIIAQEKGNLSWLPSTPEELIKWLYNVGLLCYTTKGGVLRGTRVIHSGIEPSPEMILSQKKIFVTPIFRLALKMRDRKKPNAM